MLNLLPPEYKQRNRARSLAYGITLLYFVLLVGIALAAVALATYNFVQKTSVEDKQSELQVLAGQKQQLSSVSEKAALIQDRIQVAPQYQDKRDWSEVLNSAASATPQSVRLTSLSATHDAAKNVTNLSLSGVTVDRRDVVLFKDKLALDKMTQTASISSIEESADEKKEEYTFTIQVVLKDPNAIKK